jgi:meso-butanediol dehydrogenase / (S,S)-butanediol dehydrogenase / diacetyl reductase
MEIDLNGLAVVVTGAASGIGRATALAFAANGANVFAVDQNEAGLAETREQSGGSIVTHGADLLDPANCAPVIDAAVAQLGKLDALCNIAGVLRIEPLADVTPQAWDFIYGVNVRAPFFLSQAAMPHLIESDGAIVNISSATAFRGYAYVTAYTSSKAAIAHMTKSLQAEVIKSGVRINAIAPGTVITPMGTGGGEMQYDKFDMELFSRMIQVRPGSPPESYTDIILYLASPQNQIIRGAVLNVDDGMDAM